jgi:ribosome-associated protein
MRFDIPDSELQWRFDTSGGPGGQHANRSNTRVELTFDLELSGAFDDEIRARVMTRLGTTVRIVEDGTRSQTTNRKRALRRLHARLEEAARPEPQPRRPTKPSRAARQRRLTAKRLRGKTKQRRRHPKPED